MTCMLRTQEYTNRNVYLVFQESQITRSQVLSKGPWLNTVLENKQVPPELLTVLKKLPGPRETGWLGDLRVGLTLGCFLTFCF